MKKLSKGHPYMKGRKANSLSQFPGKTSAVMVVLPQRLKTGVALRIRTIVPKTIRLQSQLLQSRTILDNTNALFPCYIICCVNPI
jgi:hypothetical protein